VHDTQVEHSISAGIYKKTRQVTIIIDGNMAALQHTITKESEI